MIVPDVNVLLYAHLDLFPLHARARAWWSRCLSEEEVGLCPPVVFGFVRIASNPRAIRPPLPVAEAVRFAESWFDGPATRLLVPGPRHLELAFGLLRTLGTARNLTTDVQIAAHGIEHQARVASHDSDFSRFPGLQWFDPLAP